MHAPTSSADQLIGQAAISILGFGEAAMAMVRGWHDATLSWTNDIRCYDIKTEAGSKHASQKWSDYASYGVKGQEGPEQALKGASIILSLVTADQAFAAAKSAATYLEQGSVYFDCNSCAAFTKRASQKLIEDAGGHYVDCAIMAPITPELHRTPMLLSGQNQAIIEEAATALQLNYHFIDGGVGKASTIKMVRSSMIKGMEALVCEGFLAACQAGVEDQVLLSLERSFPGFGWRERGASMLERMMVHGNRRAAEMKEVAKTIEDLAVVTQSEESMAYRTACWQARIGDLAIDPTALPACDYATRADALLQGLKSDQPRSD